MRGALDAVDVVQLKLSEFADPAVLISVRPQYVDKILDGSKTVELRRKFPMVETGTSLVIYSSTPTKAALATALIGAVHVGSPSRICERFRTAAGITRQEFREYFKGSPTAYAIELTNIRHLDEPLALAELRDRYNIEPPQSWRYVPWEFYCQVRPGAA